MAIKKVALSDSLYPSLVPASSISGDEAATIRFKRVTDELRRIQKKAGKDALSPKIDDFTYASCIMMHAAEASLIDESGNYKKNSEGKNVVGKFEPFIDSRGKESLKWVSPDGIKMYRNQNGDIFPEAELIKAHKDWVGKPLCRDHVSDVVDGIRGLIIDTYYDPKFKRVHALFAIDKKNYPDLARKVEAGYATNVSMGTAVGRSVCTTCGNVASVEAEYCTHVRFKECEGEINLDLAPIELSIVVTGADPGAKIKTVLAHIKDYENKMNGMNGHVFSAQELDEVRSGISSVEKELKKATASVDPQEFVLVRRLLGSNDSTSPAYEKARARMSEFLDDDLSKITSNELMDLVEVLHNKKDSDLGTKVSLLVLDRKQAGENLVSDSIQPESAENRLGLVDSAGNDLKTDVDLVDQSHFKGKPGDPMAFSGSSPDALINFSQLYAKDIKNGAKAEVNLSDKIASLKKQLSELEKNLSSKEENVMSFADLKNKSRARLAFFNGTEEPKKYAPMGDADKIRDTQDRQMVGDVLDTKVENPDQEKKEMLHRAALEERMAKRAKIVKTLTEAAAKGTEKTAFFQGTEEPKKYAPMGDADKIRDTQDRQMQQTGDLGGEEGMVPGDKEKKEMLQRMAGKLKARFDKTAKSWTVHGGGKDLLVVKAAQAYPNLDKKASPDMTYGEYFATKQYGERLMKLVRAEGPAGAAEALGVPPMAPMAPEAPAAEAPMEAPAAPAAPEAPAEDVAKLKEEIVKSVDKLEVAVDEIKAVVAEDEGLKDVTVKMPEVAAAADKGDLLEAYAHLNDCINELSFISGKLGKKASKEQVMLGRQAVRDAKVAMHDAALLVQAFQDESGIADVMPPADQACGDGGVMLVLDKEELKQVDEEVDEALDEHEEHMHGKEEDDEQDAKDKKAPKAKAKSADDLEEEIKKLQEELKAMKADKKEEKAEKEDKEEAEEHKKMDKEARKAWRQKLIANAAAADALYQQAHQGGHKLEDLSMKVPDGLDVVETLDEVHEQMMDVATKDPVSPKVRQAAQALDKSIKSGLFAAANLDKLVALGAVDSAAAQYWKTYFGQVDGGKDFAAGLVSEFKKSASVDESEVKLTRYKRAMAVAREAQVKGLCGPSQSSLEAYADSLAGVPDQVFESVKNTVAQTKVVSKTASFVPHVGIRDDQEVSTRSPSASELAKLFLK